MIVIILLRDDDIIRATYVRTLARGEKLADEAVHGGGLLVDHDGAMVAGQTSGKPWTKTMGSASPSLTRCSGRR